jgi:hypothetical protein
LAFLYRVRDFATSLIGLAQEDVFDPTALIFHSVLNETLARSAKVLRGLEATYTEHNSITNEKPENRSKSRARNLLDLQLRELLTTTIVREEATSSQ